MKKIIYIFLLSINVLPANSLDNLLDEYKDNIQNSLQTVDEKLGHVIIYSQKDLKLMQHNKLGDVLNELPVLNVNKSRFGGNTLSLPTSKERVSGYFKLFINDIEVGNASTSFSDIPLDFVDHIEIYYGESSFSLNSETGLYFIRIYTKPAQKENGGQYSTVISNNHSLSQSLTYADSFENDWSYLFFLNQSKTNNSNTYNGELLENKTQNRYFYTDISNDTTKINIAYTDTIKDIFMGYARDTVPDDGSLKTKNYFIDINKTFLNDNSLRVGASYSASKTKYKEINSNGLLITPIIDFTQNITNTIPKEINENVKTSKKLAYINKKFNFLNHQTSATLSIQEKKYSILNRKSVNLFDVETTDVKYNNFNKETLSSLIFADSYNIYDNLILIGNAKLDKYNRHGYFKDTVEKIYRIGTIYTPFNNFGFKSFYTKTSLPPSFYDADYASFVNKDLNSQEYKLFTYEAVFTTKASKLSIVYNNVKINNFIYPTAIGSANIDYQVKSEGLTFRFEYDLFKDNKILLNYYIVKKDGLIDNPSRGGNIRYTGSYKKIEYFASLIYKNKYEYNVTGFNPLYIKDSYMLNLGMTYNYTQNLSLSIKGENLLNKSTKSIYNNYSINENYSLDNLDRAVYISMKWQF